MTPWLALDRERLRLWRRAGVPVAECARRLGRTLGSVGAFLYHNDIRTRRNPRKRPADLAALERLVRAGWPDRVIAGRYGVAVTTVRRWRARLALPPDEYHALARARYWHTYRRDWLCRGHSVSDRIVTANRARAARRGWPGAETNRQCDLLDALETAGRPVTQRELTARFAWSDRFTLKLLRQLRRLGLVVATPLDGRTNRYALARPRHRVTTDRHCRVV